MQKHRIYTNIGKDQKITVELNQNFDLLEVLSLKLSQQDIYTSICSDYGVVCGRVLVNKGYGVPNAKVSIFVPLSEEDEDDPVISALYPYKTVNDANEDGYRYNLLSSRQQHGGHNPTGTFPDQLDIITREEVLQVYEKYYKFTAKTNNAGDFMIWGVPVGEQTIHIDIDLSDIGCFSLRPDDFLQKGYGEANFKSTYEFKSDSNIESLPQIKIFDKTIEVYPFFGSEDLCQIGITRCDFDLSEKGVTIQPKAMIIGGTFTDGAKNYLSKYCSPGLRMGVKCTLSSENGKIEAIRFSHLYDNQNRPVLEEYKINEDIDDDGSFALSVPMNRDYIYTDEFGDNQYTNDPSIGIPTSACYRFRFSIKDAGTEKQVTRASYLVPNIREYYTNDETSESEQIKSYAWSLNYDDYPTGSVDELILAKKEDRYCPQDYFYRFQYNKVYTVSSFHNSFFAIDPNDYLLNSNIASTRKRMLGIKDIIPAEENDCTENIVTPPTNFGRKKVSSFQILISSSILFIQYLIYQIFLIAFEALGTIFRTIPILSGLSRMIQSAGQLTLPLTIYDECELCPVDDESMTRGYAQDYCKIGEFEFEVTTGATNEIYFKILNLYESTDNGSSKYQDGSQQRDCFTDDEDQCCNSYLMNGGGSSVYNEMNNSFIEENDAFYPKFYMIIGGNSGSPINNVAVFAISSGNTETTHQIVEITSGVYGFIFTEEDIYTFFGISSGFTYFAENPISSNMLFGYVVDREYTKSIQIQTTEQSGCERYDVPYDNTIPKEYLWFKDGAVYGDPMEDIDNDTIVLSRTSPGPEYTIGASVWYNFAIDKVIKGRSLLLFGAQYVRKTKTGYSEFRDGVFTIVPSTTGISQRNLNALGEWYRRSLIGINFCGGIVDYAFIDNWLSGSLYFFQFRAKVKEKEKFRLNINFSNFIPYISLDTLTKTKVKACKLMTKYIYDHGKFYYRSCPYIPTNEGENRWGKTISELYGINLPLIQLIRTTAYRKMILHPTTFVDLGARDEFVKQICVDPILDSNCSVSRSIGATSFQNPGQIVAFAVNYRLDSSNGTAPINSFFDNAGFVKYLGSGLYFDGDILQLISINNEAGIEEFNLDSAKYVAYNLTTLDPDITTPYNSKSFYDNNTGTYGPTPITLRYNDDGFRVRQCLNTPNYLGKSAQDVPFFLWDKIERGFGSYNNGYFDDQSWDYGTIKVQPLQGMTYQYSFTNPLTNPTDQYLLPPISRYFSGVTITGAYTGLAEEFDLVLLRSEMNDDVKNDYSIITDLLGNQPHTFTLLIATGDNDTIEDPTEGKLYIRQGDENNWIGPYDWYNNPTSGSTDYTIYPTVDPYNEEKQILSTPFLFYFGLRPGKTGLDKFIERFGPKNAFPFTE